MNLVELQNKIHKQNKEMGWWDEPRPFSTFVCLFHSELSEAMEGDRKGLMDDHLPQYKMFWVELADFVIRCLDYAGSVGVIEAEYDELSVFGSAPIPKLDFIAIAHSTISRSLEAHFDGDIELINRCIASCTVGSIQYADVLGVDLTKIILEKVEYNKHRADHKRENRTKAGGKKY